MQAIVTAAVRCDLLDPVEHADDWRAAPTLPSVPGRSHDGSRQDVRPPRSLLPGVFAPLAV